MILNPGHSFYETNWPWVSLRSNKTSFSQEDSAPLFSVSILLYLTFNLKNPPSFPSNLFSSHCLSRQEIQFHFISCVCQSLMLCCFHCFFSAWFIPLLMIIITIMSCLQESYYCFLIDFCFVCDSLDDFAITVRKKSLNWLIQQTVCYIRCYLLSISVVFFGDKRKEMSREMQLSPQIPVTLDGSFISKFWVLLFDIFANEVFSLIFVSFVFCSLWFIDILFLRWGLLFLSIVLKISSQVSLLSLFFVFTLDWPTAWLVR